jgi:hypothetical protein
VKASVFLNHWGIVNSLLKVRQTRFLSSHSEMSAGCCTKGSWIVHHNNVPAHTALSIKQFLAKHSIPTPPQPPSHLTSPLPIFSIP